MTEFIWNPWHGCKRYSDGCKNCYVYRRDDSIGKDAGIITKNKTFAYPIEKRRDGTYKLASGSSVFVCMTSDFFIDEADDMRNDVWEMIKLRSDVRFTIITKRILRFLDCIPNDWGAGYDNVAICCTMENQIQCDIRFPALLDAPIKAKFVACEPLLSEIDMEKYLCPDILRVTVGGESGDTRLVRTCDFDWVLDIRRQCIDKKVPFWFHQTGALLKKDGRVFTIPRKLQHSQARAANINVYPSKNR